MSPHFLQVPAATFDSLAPSQQKNLVRVHPDFVVIALGCPCPPFRGMRGMWPFRCMRGMWGSRGCYSAPLRGVARCTREQVRFYLIHNCDGLFLVLMRALKGHALDPPLRSRFQVLIGRVELLRC